MKRPVQEKDGGERREGDKSTNIFINEETCPGKG
jgi:hypothetical protein